ncbi:retinol dehydrogenase 13-like [Patiria miniata]|uniref:Retinol dehydrogenase 13 n=1 Tax=Patiria miniata TaxID=46514 RepID=A0A914B5S7_PATMI|nr:retinol dehydrogenase 13-like [Patiria miniata]XP_038071168.1 retinol dehydrogenase 13-like [Patiria miniata]XP_038071169.1 retinol dehydrogenase 13-like [Patiria miniata]XP_038071170.1 retinol dehydrogenase 13-like [Patiria miniata]
MSMFSMDPLFVGPVIFAVIVLYWVFRRWVAGGWCHSKARLDGKTVVITGANTGIGKETAKDLARRGARVILACRDLPKAEAAAADIRKVTGNKKVTVRKLDLASMASVRECAKKIKAEVTRLDIIINNAGIMFCPEWKTEDGFEMQFGVNHLGHFLLTNLLLDLIKSSAPARIVNVSSMAHAFNKMCWDDLHMREKYDTMAAYAQSKLANVLFTKELAKRLMGSGVTVYALSPGSVKTELIRHMHGALSLPFRVLFGVISLKFLQKTAEQGAQTTIQCAVAEELRDTTGIYFSDCVPKTPSREALDEESARRLWEISAELVGLEKKVE